MIFPEGLASLEEFRFFNDEIRKVHPKVYLLANMTEFIYPVSTLRIAMKAIDVFLDDLVKNGTVENSLKK